MMMGQDTSIKKKVSYSFTIPWKTYLHSIAYELDPISSIQNVGV